MNNNFEQPQQSAPEQQKKWQEEAEEMGKEIQERRAQREAAAKERFELGEIKLKKYQQLEQERTEGNAQKPESAEEFRTEQLINPEDPRVEKVHEMLAEHFGKEEVDPIDVMKEAMTGKMKTGEECPKYLIHVAENTEGKIEGLHTGAVVETVSSDGEVSEESAVQLGCYTLTSPEARGKGVWKALFDQQEKAAKEDAENRGLSIKGFMAEAHDDMEPVLNSKEVKRVYIIMADGSFRELPYEQPPLDWEPETGKPAEGAGTVPEHLMLRLSSGANELSGEELMEMVRGMYYYNNYREEEYFNNEEAYKNHTEFVESIEQKLTEAIGEGKVYLLSAKERGTMIKQGVKFEEHMAKTAEKEPVIQVANSDREKTQEEIARHLVEHPAEALGVFKKGVGLRLENLCTDFGAFWKRKGAEALRDLSWPAEKVVGSPLAKARQSIWAVQEYLLMRPGAKRLEKVVAIQANIEALKKAGVPTEDLLKDIMKQYHDASSDVLAEDGAHRQWEDRKKETLSAMKTFSHFGEKLINWGKKQKAETAGKKEAAKQKRVRKIKLS